MSCITRRNCSISARSPTMALGRIVPFLRGAAGVGGGPGGVSFARPGRREGRARDGSALGPRLPGLLFKGTAMLSVDGGRRELSESMTSKDCETERSKLLAVLRGLLGDRGVLSKKYGDKCPGGGVSACSRSTTLRLWQWRLRRINHKPKPTSRRNAIPAPMVPAMSAIDTLRPPSPEFALSFRMGGATMVALGTLHRGC